VAKILAEKAKILLSVFLGFGKKYFRFFLAQVTKFAGKHHLFHFYYVVFGLRTDNDCK